MKCLERNKTSFHYALFLRKDPITDDYGNDSGEFRVIYDTPVEMQACVSAASGEAQIEQFGNAIMYDRVIISDEVNSPIDEHSVLCIDSPPSYDTSGNLIFDYIVTKVARSLNTVSFAISKVKVS